MPLTQDKGRNKAAVVIGGKRVLRADLPYDVIRQAIKGERANWKRGKEHADD